jgi:ribosomal protein S18 acetylase RimI-like enzyme
MSEKQYLIVPFDHQWLVENPYHLKSLSEFYCSIWEIDENFGEYRQCPNCHRYFSYEEVEEQYVRTCPDCNNTLVLAWVAKEVTQKLLSVSNQPSDQFSGFLAFNSNGGIVGFAWAHTLSIEEVEASWGKQIVDQLKTQNDSSEVAYFNELATDPSMRRHGIGSHLIRKISEWMRQYHGQKMALLRTHENSAARSLYEKIGYQICGTDTMYGYGRIMMAANHCANLKIDQLN